MIGRILHGKDVQRPVCLVSLLGLLFKINFKHLSFRISPQRAEISSALIHLFCLPLVFLRAASQPGALNTYPTTPSISFSSANHNGNCGPVHPNSDKMEKMGVMNSYKSPAFFRAREIQEEF